MGQQWPAAGALGAAGLAVAEALLEEVSINPTLELQSRRPKTAEQLYHIHCPTVEKVLGPTTDCPTRGSGNGTENPQGNLTLEGSGICL